jgi:hypothetical protein
MALVDGMCKRLVVPGEYEDVADTSPLGGIARDMIAEMFELGPQPCKRCIGTARLAFNNGTKDR